MNPDLGGARPGRQTYTVRYDAVNAMLLNEFLKEHQRSKLKSVSTKQEAGAAQQQKQIDALTAGLQKVSAQLKPANLGSQVVNNPLEADWSCDLRLNAKKYLAPRVFLKWDAATPNDPDFWPKITVCIGGLSPTA